MKKLNKSSFYILSILCIFIACVFGAVRKPLPDLISDTAVRIIQGALLVIAIICYLIQMNRDNKKQG